MKNLKDKTAASTPLTLTVFLAAVFVCLFCQLSAAASLVLGMLMAALGIVPFEKYSSTIIRYTLQVAVVGLGFGIDLHQALAAGKEGFVLTCCSIFLTLSLGIFLGRRLRLPRTATLLIAAGTAICGGSAIAALAPMLSARKEEVSVSLGVIFLLNAVALLIFPRLGMWMHLSQHQFGLWSAIAIQDTSSVVAAAATYGKTALQVATTVKLERALWIIPVSLFCLALLKNKAEESARELNTVDGLPAMSNASGMSRRPKIKIPWFIFLFLAVIILGAYLPAIHHLGEKITPLSEKLFSLTLFLIGTSFTRAALKKVGLRPLLLGIVLWLFIGTLSLVALVILPH